MPVYAQSSITKITVKVEEHFIITKMDYPIIGLYKYESKCEPIGELNKDGYGDFSLASNDVNASSFGCRE